MSIDRSLRRPTALHAIVVATSLLIGACSTGEDAAAPASDVAPDVTSGPTDPTADRSTLGWIETAGPFAELGLSATPIEDWPALFDSLRAPAGLPPLDVTTVLERDPDPCTLWRRTVGDVRFGDGPAAERMREETLAALTGVDHDPGPLLGEDEAAWCADRPRESLSYLTTSVLPEFCGLPDETPIRCVTITTFRYDGGAHPNMVTTDLVLDAATGEQLTVDRLLALRGIGLEDAAAFVEDAVCRLDVAAGNLTEGDGCWPITLRNARPTPSGLLLAFSPYESGPYAFGPRDLFVPWSELADGAAVPAAVRRAQHELREAVAEGTWEAIGALLPADGRFLVGTGDQVAAPIDLLRGLARDPRLEWTTVLAQQPGRVDGVTVWPELALRDPFVIADDERDALVSAYGADAVAAWERDGRYLGWRAGFDDDGTWRFMVAGD